ncbi:hypothetical protein BLSTO_04631 [Blastocystis sp. subtype 1]
MVGVSSLVHLLVSHWPVYCSRGHGSYRWSSSIRSGHVTRASARLVVARLSVRVVVTGLLVLLVVCCSCVVGHGRRSVTRTSLVRLLDSSLVCRWCVVGVSLVCHWCVIGVSLVCRWCVTDLSLVCRWCVIGVSLVCH